MNCPVCMHENPDGATTCASCGAALGTPGIATGHTGPGASAPYTPYLTKGVRLQNGTFAVSDVLGQGGFGITYKGGDLNLRRYVAIKELFPAGCTRQGNTVVATGNVGAAEYADIKAKFLEEARTLARFSHPGIVRVYNSFEENNTAYMVMEFLEGKTLSRLILDKGQVPEDEALGIVEKIADALTTIHAANLIHRDLKPDNICLTNDGRVVLIDFGTARSFASGKTVKQTTMLTPGYAPLEQYGQQARFGTYTDVYALGATLYHCLTGQVPPQATDRAAGVELKPPHEINAFVSQRVSEAVVRAMALKAADRPAKMEDFLAALKAPAAPMAPAAPAMNPAAPTVAPAWGGPAAGAVDVMQPQTPAYPAAGAGTANVQTVAENQIVTNSNGQEVLVAVHRAFAAAGVPNPAVDYQGYRVYGPTGPGSPSVLQHVTGAVTQDSRGVVVTFSANVNPGMDTYARQEMARIMQATTTELRRLGPDTGAAAPSPMPMPVQQASWPQQPAPPPIAMPQGNPYMGGGYQQPIQPMIAKQGGSVLTLGILGLFCCGICAPIAWITGNQALAAYGDYDPGDKGSVQAGRVMGIIGTVLWALYISINVLAVLGSR